MKQAVYEKGEYGYLRSRKRQTRNRALLFLLLTVGIFVTGLILFGSNQNYLSIAAALMCIPTGVCIVNMIMFQRAIECNDETFQAVETVKGGSLVLYDLAMTSYETIYPVLCASVLKNKILCLLQADDAKCASCSTHIREILSSNDYEACEVLAVHDLADFLGSLKQMEEERVKEGLAPVAEEENWVTGTRQTIAGILKSISL